MQSSDFNQYFETYIFLQKHFDGVFSIDTLPKKLNYRHFCICNTDKQSESGQHWFCFIRNSKFEIECFDSLGITEEKKEQLLKYCCFTRTKQLRYNETSFQTKTSDTCGLFTIYFLFERMHNLDLTFHEVLEEIFDEDEEKNESKVIKFCENILTNN
jgi:hypothetical protein